MKALDRLTDALVRRAARRWPSDVAESLLREWRAELATLQTQPQIGSAATAWRQLAFALSLACSPTAEPRGSMGSECKRMAITLARVGRQFVLALGVVVLARFVAVGMRDLADQLVTHNRYDVEPATWWYVTAYAGADIVGLAIMGLVAMFALRRTRMAVRPAAVLIVPLALASYLVYLAGHAGNGYGSSGLIPAQGMAAIGAWALVLIVAVGIGRRLAAAGRRTAAWAVTGLGAFVAADVAAFTASVRAAGMLHIGRGSGLLWLPLSYLPDGFTGIGPLIPAGTTQIGSSSFGSDQAFPALSLLLPLSVEVAVPLLMCSSFVVVAALRPRPQSVTARDRAVPAPAPHRMWSFPGGRGSFARLPSRQRSWVSPCGPPPPGWPGQHRTTPFDRLRSRCSSPRRCSPCSESRCARSVANWWYCRRSACWWRCSPRARSRRGRAGPVPEPRRRSRPSASSPQRSRGGWANAYPGRRRRRQPAGASLVGIAVIGALATPTAVSVSDIFANHAWIQNAVGATGAVIAAGAAGVGERRGGRIAARHGVRRRPGESPDAVVPAGVRRVPRRLRAGVPHRHRRRGRGPARSLLDVPVILRATGARRRSGRADPLAPGPGCPSRSRMVRRRRCRWRWQALRCGSRCPHSVCCSAPGFCGSPRRIGFDGMDAGLLWAQVALGVAVAFALGPWIAPHDRPDATDPVAPPGEPEPHPT